MVVTKKNQNGHAVPVLTREDLVRLMATRRDATLNEIWPASRKRPAADVFWFDLGNGDLRPSRIVPSMNIVQVVKRAISAREGTE